MRVWHLKIITKLCNRHLIAQHNEAHTIYKIVTAPKVIVDGKKYYKFCTGCGAVNQGNKNCHFCGKVLNGYINHPAVKEFEEAPEALWLRLSRITLEMELRQINHQPMPDKVIYGGPVKEWQSLDTQLDVLRDKQINFDWCTCNV